ncbi:MAG: pantetheine-phosphate adenylyltransferase [Candidatus Gastranaerophilales bacterium]|nr:pantetheine-phosphate adenylyltransferase [Candidatus Gastranaerophilales bacterium]MCM1073361.1 pantetheine-phosphate adenylyltransferase [Bacteroides sp.]
MNIAIYPGSFDPITNGHLDILKNGAEIFDKVIVAVSYNVNKQGFLPVETRLELIRQCVSEFKNVEVDSYEGFTVDYAKQKGASVILRGLRNQNDFEYELQISQTNNALCSDIKTVFLITKPEYGYISSSMVREVFAFKGDVSKFVPKAVNDYLKAQ